MASIRNFNSFVLSAKVIDILLQGITFTWSNHIENESWARLDRFLVSPMILSWFPNLSQRGILGSISDYNVIKLGEPYVDWGYCPFKFYNGWLEDANLIKEVSQGWTDCKVKGSLGLVLSSKMKAVKGKLKGELEETGGWRSLERIG
ncbi:hypothetical protein Dsin_014381 [Dipteronia sinensis]|uniref:Uncharacterized protein n=1 Tax=Dipteronia sinensis TaxID=43782 RepID=A0AAE0ALV4_9ROSI|nr:hypothetical protein Dsin_014381 [Dipteronia sinensis]